MKNVEKKTSMSSPIWMDGQSGSREVGGRRPFTTPDGRLLRRVGGDAQPLRGDALARFVSERQRRAGEDQPLVVARSRRAAC